MKQILLLTLLFSIAVIGCRELPTNAEAPAAVPSMDASTEKMPLEDTTQFTQLTWLATTDQSLGKLTAGKEIKIKWRFKNTGTKPLIIEGVTASCGCTIPEKPEKPLLPGEEGIIKAKYNGSGSGYIVKQVHVVANTNPSKNHTLSFSGEIPAQKQ